MSKRAKFRRGEIVVHRGSDGPLKIRKGRDSDGFYYVYGPKVWVHESEIRKQTRREKGERA